MSTKAPAKEQKAKASSLMLELAEEICQVLASDDQVDIPKLRRKLVEGASSTVKLIAIAAFFSAMEMDTSLKRIEKARRLFLRIRDDECFTEQRTDFLDFPPLARPALQAIFDKWIIKYRALDKWERVK